MIRKEVISYIQNHYPNISTKEVADYLNLNPNTVRSIAKKNNISKSGSYREILKLDLVENRRKWYESKIPSFLPTIFEEQIIFGSLLGDGYISKGAKRSKNFYYQEHFGNSQRKYRQWKLSHLTRLGFSIKGNFLRSTSHPYFTKLHPMLYRNGEKIITSNFLAGCIHPIFLLSLYLDDGSLSLSYYYNKAKHTVYCHPSIVLYTLNFSFDENTLLASHLNNTFGTNFIVSRNPDGKGSMLKLNKESEVSYFLKLIEPYTKEVNSMAYKINLSENIKIKTTLIQSKFGSDVKIVLSSSNRNKPYTQKEINLIINLKLSGQTDQSIANSLGRTYWSIVYKIRELRRNDIL